MSFGQHAYQHRFFKQPSKFTRISSQNNSIIPNRSYFNNELRQNIPVIRLSPQQKNTIAIPTADSLDQYSYNSLILDRYREDAQLYRKYKRFGLGYDRYESLPPFRVRTEPFYPYVEPINSRILYKPQRLSLVQYDLFMRNRERMQSCLERQRQKSEKYRRRYNKLKNKFTNQLIQLKQQKQEQQRVRQLQELQKSTKINKIEHEIQDLSQKLVNNSKIINDSVKLAKAWNISQQQNQRIIFPRVPTIVQIPIILDRVKLDSQTAEVNRLRKQIRSIDNKLYQYKLNR